MRSGNIIILETDEGLRASRTRALSHEGYNITGVTAIEEAIEATRQQSYDLLIVGVRKPEKLSALLTPLAPEMSVLMLATIDTIGKVVEYAGTGIHSFLLEPCSLGKFKSIVTGILNSTRLVKAGIRNEILTSLTHANRPLNSEVETEQFFKRVVEISATDTDAESVVLLVKDEATGTLVTRAQAGKWPPELRTICSHVIDVGKPILIDETTRDSKLRQMMSDTGATAIMCVPLLIKGSVAGAMGHTKVTKGAKFTTNDLSFASLIAWWCSMALENTRLFGRIQRQYLHMERLLEELRVAQDNERHRVAVEIHDGAAQWMVGASYGIKAVGNLVSEQRLADLELELTKINDTVQTSIKELRRAISNLRPLQLEELGLTAALSRAAESLQEDNIECQIEIDGDLPQLTPAQESTTYWIVQEILSNIRKHSGASEVTARIQYHDNEFSVEVNDNGQGFSSEQVINSESRLVHLGLLGMKERAELLGGRLDIKSEKEKGTMVSFTFPVSSVETVEAATSV